MTAATPSNRADQETTPRLTAWNLFFDDTAEAKRALDAAISEHGVLRTLPEEAPRLQSVAARYLGTQVRDQILALLQRLPVGDMLVGGWGQLQKVAQAIDATQLDGSSRNVSILNHEITFSHQPTIELLINEVPVHLLDVTVEAVFAIDACELLVTAGAIAHLTPGPMTAKVTIKANEVRLLEPALTHVDVTRLFTTATETGGRR